MIKLRDAEFQCDGRLPPFFADGVIELYSGGYPLFHDDGTHTLLGTLQIPKDSAYLSTLIKACRFYLFQGRMNLSGIAAGTATWFSISGNVGDNSNTITTIIGFVGHETGDLLLSNVVVEPGDQRDVLFELTVPISYPS